MKYTKHFIGALFAALIATAFVASAAQANPEFYIKNPNIFLAGLNLVSGLIEGANVAAGGSELLLASGVAIFCEHQEGEGWINNEAAQGIGLVEVKYSKNCRVLGAEVTCKVDEPIVAKAKAKLILHEVSKLKEPYVLFTGELEPVEERFTQITILNQPGKVCLIAQTANIHGLIAAEALLGLRLLQQLHFNDAVNKLICGTVAEGGLNLCTGGLKFGAENASLDSLPVLELLNRAEAGWQQNGDKEWEVK